MCALWLQIVLCQHVVGTYIAPFLLIPFRFYEDAVKLCSDAKAPKLIAEIQRLQQWLTKHQDENLSDAGKQKLLAACETYFKFAVA